MPSDDVRKFKDYPWDWENVYGILAAPPCTQFSLARTNAKTPRDFKDAMGIVYACLQIVWQCQYKPAGKNAKFTRLKFWALENPARGLLKSFIGKPCYTFNPYDFGDMYKKETALWGNFNFPIKTNVKRCVHTVECTCPPRMRMVKFDYLKSKDIHPEFYGKFDRQTRRAITPQGFANAFFKANQ